MTAEIKSDWKRRVAAISNAPFFRSTAFPMVLFVFAIGAIYLVNEGAREYALRKDLQLLQGEWVLVSSQLNGNLIEQVQVCRRKVTGNKYQQHWVDERGVHHDADGVWTLDPTQNPKTFDVVISSESRTDVIRGIYTIEGDTFTTCYMQAGAERPENFESGNTTLNVWKKIGD
jgi:uncharacterized protein (TIGR03067 family)